VWGGQDRGPPAWLDVWQIHADIPPARDFEWSVPGRPGAWKPFSASRQPRPLPFDFRPCFHETRRRKSPQLSAKARRNRPGSTELLAANGLSAARKS